MYNLPNSKSRLLFVGFDSVKKTIFELLKEFFTMGLTKYFQRFYEFDHVGDLHVAWRVFTKLVLYH